MQQFLWDNLRRVLIVANTGSIASAVRESGVNRAFVLRRIDSYQESLGCHIFERSPAGYVLIIEAEKIILAAQEIDKPPSNRHHQIASQVLYLEGE